MILDELQRRADQRQMIWDLYAATMWQVHPLKHRVLGYKDTVLSLSLADLVAHYRRFFVPTNTVIAVAGNIPAAIVRNEVESLYQGFEGETTLYPPAPTEPPLIKKRECFLEKSLHQTHLIFGWPTVGMGSQDKYPLKLVDRILGVGGSCRLYQRLREKDSLVYNISSVRAIYEDVGYFAIYAMTPPSKLNAVRRAILEEIQRLREEPVTKEELAEAKQSYEGALAVNSESNLWVAGIYGVEELFHHIEPLTTSLQRIKAVTQGDIQRVAKTYFDPERYVSVVVGPTPCAS